MLIIKVSAPTYLSCRAPGIPLHTYHGGSQRERARSVAKIQRRGGVLLTSYGMIVSSAELIAKKDGESFGKEFKYVSSCWGKFWQLLNLVEISGSGDTLANFLEIVTPWQTFWLLLLLNFDKT